MERCVIFASQPVAQAMRRYVRPGDFVIAADAGWRRAVEVGITPDLVVGDFDSAQPPAQLNCHVLPAEKDDTDTFFAAKEALRRGAKEVVLLGAWGGAPEHALGNLQVLQHLAGARVRAIMAQEHSETHCLAPGSWVFPREDWHYFSVFALAGTARGITLEGAKYPLRDYTMQPDVPIGVSNEFAADSALVAFREGLLTVVLSRREEEADA